MLVRERMGRHYIDNQYVREFEIETYRGTAFFSHWSISFGKRDLEAKSPYRLKVVRNLYHALNHYSQQKGWKFESTP